MKLKIIVLAILLLAIGVIVILSIKNKGTEPTSLVTNENVEEASKTSQTNNIDDKCKVLIPVSGQYTYDDLKYPSQIPKGVTKTAASVKDIDYKNKKITLDFITVKLKPVETDGGGDYAEITNQNKQLRTFSFDDDTFIYMSYMGMTSFYEDLTTWCQENDSWNIDMMGGWGWYSLAKLPFNAAEDSLDFKPYVEATVLNDKLLFLVRPTLSS